MNTHYRATQVQIFVHVPALMVTAKISVHYAKVLIHLINVQYVLHVLTNGIYHTH